MEWSWSFELDMAEAYAGVIKRLKRKFNLNDNYIELTDVLNLMMTQSMI